MPKEWIVPNSNGFGYTHFWEDTDGWIVAGALELAEIQFHSPKLSELIAKLNEAASIFIGDPDVDLDAHMEYDMAIASLAIEGKRRATEDEVAVVEKWIADEPARVQAQADFGRRDAEIRLRQLQIQHPELFATSPDIRHGEDTE